METENAIKKIVTLDEEGYFCGDLGGILEISNCNAFRFSSVSHLLCHFRSAP